MSNQKFGSEMPLSATAVHIRTRLQTESGPTDHDRTRQSRRHSWSCVVRENTFMADPDTWARTFPGKIPEKK
jgi:hypothetical protein